MNEIENLGSTLKQTLVQWMLYCCKIITLSYFNLLTTECREMNNDLK